ncbi:hypothetical protein Dimus_017507 [Dionaea muscipula]
MVVGKGSVMGFLVTGGRRTARRQVVHSSAMGKGGWPLDSGGCRRLGGGGLVLGWAGDGVEGDEVVKSSATTTRQRWRLFLLPGGD